LIPGAEAITRDTIRHVAVIGRHRGADRCLLRPPAPSAPPASEQLGAVCIVGAASLLTNTCALYALHGALGLLLPAAATLSFIASFIVNFSLNRMWTFDSDGAMFGHLWRYLSLVLVNLGLNAARSRH
jgi:putative flippase GtrA